MRNRDRAPWYLAWLYSVLIFIGIIRPVDEGCISSVYTGASNQFTAEMSGKYFNEKAKMKEPNPASKDQAGLERLEQWTKEVVGKDGWL